MFCDTDSLAIVATETGGPITTNNEATPSTVRALSYAQVDEILDSFAALNPYDPQAVPGSVLRLDTTGYCHAISAKRYAIWQPGDSPGQPVKIIKASGHGLGHLLNPYGPPANDDEESPDWQAELWQWIIGRELGLNPERPAWFDQPALGRYTITSASLLEPFNAWNEGREWADQVKPYNFLLIAHVDRLSTPVDVDGPFTLIAPFSNQPEDWTRLPWRNRYDPTGPVYTIGTRETVEAERIVRVQTYADIVGAYQRHPEAKFADADGEPCGAHGRAAPAPSRRTLIAGVHRQGSRPHR